MRFSGKILLLLLLVTLPFFSAALAAMPNNADNSLLDNFQLRSSETDKASRPPDNIASPEKLSISQSYRWYLATVIFLLLAETGLIVYLLIHRTRLRRIEASQLRTQFCIDRAVEGIFMVAEDGRFLFGNQSLRYMLGYPEDEFVTLRVFDIDPQLSLEGWPEFWNDCKSTGGMTLERVACTRDGQEFPVELTVNYYSQIDREFLFGSIRDISARKQAEDALRSIQVDLEQRVAKRTGELASINQMLQKEIEVRQQAETALLKNKTRLQAMFQNMAAGILATDSKGRFIEVNDKMLEMLGCDRHEILGKKPYEITHPDDLPQSVDTLERALQGEFDSFRLEKRYLRKDGSTFWGELTVNKIFDDQGRFMANLAIVLDITERKRTEEALRESEARYRSLFEAAAAGLVTMSPEGRFITVNQAFCDFIGYSHMELLELTVDDITHPEDRSRTTEMYNNMRRGLCQNIHYEKRYRRKDGSMIWGHASVASVPGADLIPMYYVGLVQDITERKKFEEAMAQAKFLAEQASQAKSQFLANMSHEIRTPLNVVTGYSELLSSMVSDPAQQSYLETIKTAGKSLLTLVNDILDLSKIEAGMLEIDPSPVSLQLLFGEIRQIFKTKLDSHNILFQVEIDPDLPTILMLDETRIRQVLLNLVGNAVKFTHQGDVRLRAKKLAGHEPGRIDLLVAVEDTGIGISMEEQGEIFEAFKQLGSQDTKQYGGTGLGLAICKRLVEMMDGQISVANRTGGGSIFQVILRGVEIASLEEMTFTEVAPLGENIQFDKAKVLVVDDIESNRNLLCELLGRVNLDVLAVENGQEALNLVEEYRPQLIIMDLWMPVMDGVEATRQLKANPKTEKIPIIALTASTVEDQTSLMEKGFDGYLQKPAGAGRLFSELAKYLAHRVTEEAAVESIGTVSLEIDKITKLDELRAAVRQEVLPLYEELKGAMELNKVHQFGDGLVSLGKKHNAHSLVDYGAELISYADRVDVVHSRRKIAQFSQLFKQLNNAVGKGHDG